MANLCLVVDLAVSDAHPTTLQVESEAMTADAAAEVEIKTTIVDSSKTGIASPVQVEGRALTCSEGRLLC